MRRRDWAGTVLVTCLIAAAGLLRDQTAVLMLLSAAILFSIAVILWDVLRRRAAPRPTAAAPQALTMQPTSRYMEGKLADQGRGSLGELPVPDEHRRELQAIASRLLEGVKHTETAQYLPADRERVNVAKAFNQHFPRIAQQVRDWNGLVTRLATEQDALRDWIENQLVEAGLGGGPTAYFLAREAQSDEPHFVVNNGAGEIQIGGSRDRFVFSLVGWEDREAKEVELQRIFDHATTRPERARIDIARHEMRTAQRSLIDALELVRDKAVIRGRCQLCA